MAGNSTRTNLRPVEVTGSGSSDSDDDDDSDGDTLHPNEKQIAPVARANFRTGPGTAANDKALSMQQLPALLDMAQATLLALRAPVVQTAAATATARTAAAAELVAEVATRRCLAHKASVAAWPTGQASQERRDVVQWATSVLGSAGLAESLGAVMMSADAVDTFIDIVFNQYAGGRSIGYMAGIVAETSTVFAITPTSGVTGLMLTSLAKSLINKEEMPK